MMSYDRVWAGPNAKNVFSVEVDKIVDLSKLDHKH